MDRQTKIAIMITIAAIILIVALAMFGYISGAWEHVDAS